MAADKSEYKIEQHRDFTVISGLCRLCKSLVTVSVPTAKVQAWIDEKEYIQDIFPELTDDDREFLLSRACGPCFDEHFGEV